ncbi:MAG: hypothetical protein E4G90_01845 [Gemmatimonadales bacterium]|nr:MAG: hypothetical protein E4G90_01845 [Gemmatimonadales bacterium]
MSNAESIQPVVGPFAAGGLEFAFLDASGAGVTDPLALNRITARLISAMDDRDALAGAVSGGAGRMDSLRTTAQVPWEF